MSTTRWSFAALPLLVLLPACGDARSEAPPPPAPAIAVRVVPVERAALERPLRATGRLGHKRTLTLAFKNGGTVRALFVDAGQRVKKGQRLALVDRTEIDAQVAQARAAVDKADRDQARVGKLHAGAAAAQNDLDNASTAAELAHAGLTAALYNQGQTVLYAPEDGRIDKRLVEVGEQVAPGRPIFAMAGDAAGLVARVGVVDRELPTLAVGDAASLTIDAWPGRTLDATVSEIATVPSIPSGTYEVELRVKSGGAPLVAGMTAKVTVARRAATTAVVPLGALVDARGTEGAVYALERQEGGHTVRRVPVTIAFFTEDRVAISAGLRGDEQVVAEGASFVEPGRRVRPLPAREVADAHR